MPETNDSPDPVSEPVSDAAARAKFEQEKMSRRAALRKIGLTSGMALFGMLAVDDLARIALRGLQQHKETQAVAETVAQELRSSGVAFADDADDSVYYDCKPCTSAEANDRSCIGGQKCKHVDKQVCANCVVVKSECYDDADKAYADCYATYKYDPNLANLQACEATYAGAKQGCLDYASNCIVDNGCNGGHSNGTSGCANCVTAKTDCYDKANNDFARCYTSAGSDKTKQDFCGFTYKAQQFSCSQSTFKCCGENGCNC